ncbi:hypothetical protein ACJZ2D_016856 [Fusarium nematophilum]
MPPRPPHMSSNNTTSAEKKRMRDRRAQQNLRDKRERHVRALERQVELCKILHRPGNDPTLAQTCHALQEQNKVLRQRLAQVQHLVSSWHSLPSEIDILPLSRCGLLLSHQDQADDMVPNDSASVGNNGHHNDKRTGVGSNHDNNSGSAQKDCGNCLSNNSLPLGENTYALGSMPWSITPESSNDTVLPVTDDPHSFNISETHKSVFPPPLSLEKADPAGPPWDFDSSLSELLSLELEQSGHPSSQHERDPMMIDNTDVFTHNRAGTSVERRRQGASEVQQTQTIPTRDPPLPAHGYTQLIHSLANAYPLTSSSIRDEEAALIRFRTPPLLLSPSRLGLPSGDYPPWAQVPLTFVNRLSGSKYAPWESILHQIASVAEVPSAQDLLYGSKKNVLANCIRHCLHEWRCHDVETVAIGWLIYVFIKWRENPTAERFARLPDYLKPVAEQLQLPHDSCLDMILWRKLRSNLIRYQNAYNLDHVLEVFSRSLRVKWSRQEILLDVNERDELIVRAEFFERFMSEDGWGLSYKFVNQFPELTEGLSLDAVVYDDEG